MTEDKNRLDKLLSSSVQLSRSDIKKLIYRGQVCVNGLVVKDPKAKVSHDATVCVNGEQVKLFRRCVLIMNKPRGYVTSTDDPSSPTVMELIPQQYRNLKVLPVGRLDKDTESLLVFTNDGDLIHRLISPKSGIRKKYYAEFEGSVSNDCTDNFKNGITLKDGTLCKPAVFEKVNESSCYVTVTEGMYHQVRRMMASQNLHVTYLKRVSEYSIELGDLEPGHVKEIELSANI